MNEIILWELNDEFDIKLKKDYTMTWPEIKINTKNGDPICVHELRDVSIFDVMRDLHRRFPESKFLSTLINHPYV